MWLETKNVHFMRQPGLAEFPDCVAARSTRHLRELEAMVARGDRAMILFVVQRMDCDRFSAARDADTKFAEALDHAADVGVKILIYGTQVNTIGVTLAHGMSWSRQGPATPY